jgi:monolysocardiolipin acyltransferase
MPEGRPFPYKFFPRRGQHLSITFGEPIDPSSLLRTLDPSTTPHPSSQKQPQDPAPAALDATNAPSDAEPRAFRPMPWLAPAPLRRGEPGEGLASSVQGVRSRVTAVVQEAVEALGRKVSGELLGKR